MRGKEQNREDGEMARKMLRGGRKEMLGGGRAGWTWMG